MKSKSINITWLEYRGKIEKKPYGDDKYKISHHHSINIDEYKEIYEKVGKKYSWFGRSSMRSIDLKKIILNEKVEIHLIKKDRESIGFYEIDYTNDYLKEKELRIVHFGLVDKYIGNGLGIKLMNAAITRAYRLNIDKIILQTNSLDHKRALPFYKEYGFEIFATEKKDLIYAVN